MEASACYLIIMTAMKRPCIGLLLAGRHGYSYHLDFARAYDLSRNTQYMARWDSNPELPNTHQLPSASWFLRHLARCFLDATKARCTHPTASRKGCTMWHKHWEVSKGSLLWPLAGCSCEPNIATQGPGADLQDEAKHPHSLYVNFLVSSGNYAFTIECWPSNDPNSGENILYIEDFFFKSSSFLEFVFGEPNETWETGSAMRRQHFECSRKQMCRLS